MIGRILVACGGAESRGAAAAVRLLLDGAAESAQVVVLYVNEVEYQASAPEREATDVHPEGRRQVAAIVDELNAAGVKAEGRVREGLYEAVYEDILAEADELGADIIVVGCRARAALKTVFTGSVSHDVIRHAGCPVLVVHEQSAQD